MIVEAYTSQIVQTVAHLVLFVAIRWQSVRLVKKFARKSERVEQRTGLIIKYIDLATIFILILGLVLIWGLDFRNLGIVMSSVFAVIGIGFFAQWSILSNITSGVIMFFIFPYKIGDLIKIHDNEFPYEGVIEDIKSFHIIIRTVDNEIITYPNTMMLQKGVSVVKPENQEGKIGEDKNILDTPLD